MAGGRPTKYNQEALELAKDYIVNFSDYGDPVPTIAGLACELEVCRDTVYDWSKDESKSEFSYIVKRLMTAQERKLTGGSLNNELNPMIAKLMLGKHGYSEKQQIDNTSSDGSMTPKAYSQEQYAEAQSKLKDKLGDLD